MLDSHLPVFGMVSQPFPPAGRTFTLVSHLGNFLIEIERMYGPRDKRWTILGVEFGQGPPAIWYPNNIDHVIVSLSNEARLEPKRALWQLAHEAVHLLSPTGKQNAPFIEEGLAALYADLKSKELKLGFDHTKTKYAPCATLVEILLGIDKDAIKKIRKLEPSFVKLTPAIIKKAVRGVDDLLAKNLCQPYYGTP